MNILSIVGRIVPIVGRVVKVVTEAQEAVKAGQEFAAEVQSTLEGDHPLKEKAEAMLKEFKDVDEAIDAVFKRTK